ncbi:LysR family transcriptional regulator [Tatumella sp. UBA2305]|uniref:LysR family transcriptional regulator n=1 Tax=Tatumella sp. UBA2305 TaxID=1947647 RepID=UPI0025E5C597|nr:LysR family transcriptional regulator [Tatumella sp. UBA2305]
MDIKLLRAFVTLARLGNYRAAAEKLCITQPALTKQIQSLEFHCGMTLFQRGRQGARLTISGHQLLEQAAGVIAHFDSFVSQVAEIQRGNVGVLNLGFGVSSFRIAPKMVAGFRLRFPQVQVSLNDISSVVQYQRLAEGQLQAGFVRLPAPEPLSSRVLAQENLVLAVASEGSVSVTRSTGDWLSQCRLLQLTKIRGEGLFAQITMFLKANQLVPQSVSEADDIQTLLARVSAGEGIALLPASVANILPQGVSLHPVVGENSHWQTGIAWDPRIKDPLRDNFLDTVFNMLTSASKTDH